MSSLSDFNHGKPFHGSDEIQEGRLTGATDSDYFYFFCPRCEGGRILQVLDFAVVSERQPDSEYEGIPPPKSAFTIAFEFACNSCGLHDFVKITSTGLVSGRLEDLPWDKDR